MGHRRLETTDRSQPIPRKPPLSGFPADLSPAIVTTRSNAFGSIEPVPRQPSTKNNVKWEYLHETPLRHRRARHRLRRLVVLFAAGFERNRMGHAVRRQKPQRIRQDR